MSPLAAINLQPGTIMRPSDDYCKQNGGATSDRYLLIKTKEFTTKQFLRPMMIETQTLLAPDGQLTYYDSSYFELVP